MSLLDQDSPGYNVQCPVLLYILFKSFLYVCATQFSMSLKSNKNVTNINVSLCKHPLKRAWTPWQPPTQRGIICPPPPLGSFYFQFMEPLTVWQNNMLLGNRGSKKLTFRKTWILTYRGPSNIMTPLGWIERSTVYGCIYDTNELQRLSETNK